MYAGVSASLVAGGVGGQSHLLENKISSYFEAEIFRIKVGRTRSPRTARPTLEVHTYLEIKFSVHYTFHFSGALFGPIKSGPETPY